MTNYTVGDTTPPLTGTVNAVLTGATLEVHIPRPDNTGVLIHPATIVDPTAGTWSMPFVTGDLTLAGTYRVEVQVTFSDTKVQTFYFDTDDQANTFEVRDQFA